MELTLQCRGKGVLFHFVSKLELSYITLAQCSYTDSVSKLESFAWNTNTVSKLESVAWNLTLIH